VKILLVLALMVLPNVALAGWTQTAETNGCVFFKAEADAEGVQAVRAVCDWDVAPKDLQRLLAKHADHDLYFSSVSHCDVLGSANGVDRAWQRHEAAGITAREVVVDMWSEPIPGGLRFNWKKSANQTGLTGDGVEVVKDTGKWEVTEGKNGGSHVVYELAYGPGGMVPSFVVRWFQGAGTQALVGELLAYARRGR
jgi:hypothetical protein